MKKWTCVCLGILMGWCASARAGAQPPLSTPVAELWYTNAASGRSVGVTNSGMTEAIIGTLTSLDETWQVTGSGQSFTNGLGTPKRPFMASYHTLVSSPEGGAIEVIYAVEGFVADPPGEYAFELQAYHYNARGAGGARIRYRVWQDGLGRRLLYDSGLSAPPTNGSVVVSGAATVLLTNLSPYRLVQQLSVSQPAGADVETNRVSAYFQARTLRLPDLRAVSAEVILPEPVRFPNPVAQVVTRVVNQGTEVADGTWTDRLYFIDRSYGYAERVLTNVARTGPLAAGAGYWVTNQVTLPVATYGAYQLQFLTDADAGIEELTETNNLVETSIRLENPRRCDLAVAEIHVPSNGTTNNALVKPVYRNSSTDLGTRFNFGGTEIGDEVLLDRGGVENPGGYLVKRLAFEYWGSGFSGNETVRVRFYRQDGPDFNGLGRAPGSVLWDSGAWPIAATTRAVLAFEEDLGNGAWVPRDFTWSVEFGGIEEGEAAGVDLYGPPTLGDGYRDCWVRSGAGWSLIESELTSLDYGVEIDAVPVPERTAMIVGVPYPSLRLVARIENRGTNDAVGNWGDSLYFSSNGVVSVKLTGTARTGPVPPGGSYWLTNDLVLPAPSNGVFQLTLKADSYEYLLSDDPGALAETDESNNPATVTVNFEVSQPDLVPVRAKVLGGGDVSLEDTVVVPGPLPESAHPLSPSGYVEGAWTNRVPGAEAIRIAFDPRCAAAGWSYVSILDGAGQPILNSPFPVSALAGATKLVLGDTAILRSWSSLDDGWGWGVAEIRGGKLPVGEVAVVSEDTLPAVQAVFSVANQGQEPAPPHYDTLFLSSDQILDAGDTLLNRWYVGTNTPVGTAYGVSGTFSLPVSASGTHYLIFASDRYDGYDRWGSVREYYETNNVLAAVPLAVRVTPPDLAPIAQRVPPVVTAAGTNSAVALSFCVTNGGVGGVHGTWSDSVYLSTNSFFDSSATWLGSSRHTGPLLAGQSYWSTNVVAPRADRSGEYYLFFVTDRSYYADPGALVESNETNNVSAAVRVWVEVAKPDLAIGSVMAPAAVSTSGSAPTVQLTYCVTNQGGGIASNGWYNSVYFSSNAQWSASVAQIGQSFVGQTLAPGQSVWMTNEVTLPVATAGTYYLYVAADSRWAGDTGTVAENNETNNLTAAIPITVNLIVPDLVPSFARVVGGDGMVLQDPIAATGPLPETEHPYPSSLDQSWTNRVPGAEALSIRFDARCAGGMVYLTDANGVDSPGTPCDAISLAGRTKVIPGDTVVVRFVNSWYGSGWGLAVNELHGGRLSGAPLVVNTVNPNPTLQLVCSVANQGLGTANGWWYDTLLFSTNDTPEFSDTTLRVWYRQGPTLAGGAYVVTNTVTLPVTQSGTYYLFFATDRYYAWTDSGNLYEANETNNVTAAIPITVNLTPPDLVPIAPRVPPVVASPRPNPTVEVAFGVTNSGSGGALGSWYDSVYFSTNDVLDANDANLGSWWHAGPLATNGGYWVTNSVTLPVSASGEYYLFFVTDRYSSTNLDSVYETNEANNVSAPVRVRFDLSPPDLAVADVLAPSLITDATPYPTIQLVYSVTNQGLGKVSAGWYDSVYFSSNAVWNSAVTRIGQTCRGEDVAPGQRYWVTNTLTLPIVTNGTYHLWVVTDSRWFGDTGLVYESDETNNVSAPKPIEFRWATPDLAPVFLRAPYKVTSAYPNPRVEVVLGVTNRGIASVSGTWYDQLYFSTNAYRDVSAIWLDAWAQSFTLPPGGFYTVSNTVTLPVRDSGTYYLFARTDDRYGDWGLVRESDETNNWTLILPIVFERLARPDLAATNLRLLSGVLSGQPTTFAWSVTNQGSVGLTNAVWRERLAVSNALDGALALAEFAFTNTLLPGEGITRTQVVRLPASLPAGASRFLVDADSRAEIDEVDEYNNRAWAAADTSVPAALSLSLAASVLTEGAPMGVTIVRNGSWAQALSVTVTHSDPTELSFAAGSASATTVATIPAHQASAEIQVWALPDSGLDGAQTVTIRAEAEGYLGASATLTVDDPRLPDLSVRCLDVPATAQAGAMAQYGYQVSNLGSASTSNAFWTRAYLSSDTVVGNDTLLDEYRWTAPLEAGARFDRNFAAPMPSAPGRYWLVVHTDPENSIQEGLEDNNLSLGLTPVEVSTSHGAWVRANPTLAPAGTPVTFSGQATNGVGAAVAFCPVSVHIRVREVERIVSATTDADGGFRTVWQPLPQEAGLYQVFATHPGVAQCPVQATFTLVGLRARPESQSIGMIQGSTHTAVARLENLGDAPLTGLTASVVSQPAGLTVQPDLGGQTTLSGSGSVDWICRLTADATAASGAVVVRVSAAEGASADFTFQVQVEAPRARLASFPASLTAGMVRGRQTLVAFDVVNLGGRASGPLTLQWPATTWLSAAVTNPLPSLAPGQSNRVTLLLSPEAELPLSRYGGDLALNGDDVGLSVPFEFLCLSEAKGALTIAAMDEMTYYAAGAPPLTNASVVLSESATGREVTHTVTDGSGSVRLTGLPEAYYDLRVSATHHDDFRATVWVAAGQDQTIKAFLPRHLVVTHLYAEPDEFSDRYTFRIEATFETAVPWPVITIEPGGVDLCRLASDDQQIDFKIHNHGLIAGRGANLVFASHPNWEIRPLVDSIGDLPAQSATVIPVRFRRLAASTNGPASIAAHLDYSVGTVDGNRYYSAPILVYNARNSDCESGGAVPIVSVGGGGGGGVLGTGWSPVTPSIGEVVYEQNTNAFAAVQVRMAFDQNAAVARSGLVATLELDNRAGSPLTGIRVALTLFDSSNRPAGALFGVDAPTLLGLSAVDGSGALAPGAAGGASWRIVPSPDAAPSGPVDYTVGGTLEYVQDGLAVSIPLLPVPIAVLPAPRLWVDWFLERDVFSDDPLTETIEPAVPFGLGLIMRNVGAGSANSVRIEGAQPTITTDASGLAPQFVMLGAQVGGQPVQPSLTVSLGDIPTGASATAVWWMTNNLQGLFTNCAATFAHRDALGNTNLSVIDRVALHLANHLVRVTGTNDDGAPDYLVNDLPDERNLPDVIYLSQGGTLPVRTVQTATTDGTPSRERLQVRLTASMPAGWTYLRVPEPSEGRLRLTRVQRADGGALLLHTNVWVTDRTFPGQGQPPLRENVLHLLDHDSPGEYILTYEAEDVPNTPPVLGAIADLLVAADNGAGPVFFTVSDTETPTDQIIVRVATSDESLVPAGNVALGGSGEQRWLTVTPVPNRTGSATLTLTAFDAEGGRGSRSFTVRVTGNIATRTFLNSAMIAIPTSGAATPYPSQVTVSGMSGQVLKATVTLNNLFHTRPEDLSVLLVSPEGRAVQLMSHAGGANALTAVTLQFNDTSAAGLPDASRIASGTYAPASYGAGVTYAAPAPAGPYGSWLNTLIGASPNGAWSLYVYDEQSPNSGRLATGWTLRLVTTNEALREADLAAGGALPVAARELSRSLAPVGSAQTPAIGAIRRLANGSMRVTGFVPPGQTVTLEASADLQRWEPIQSGTTELTEFEFIDSEAAQRSHRYYRLVLP